MLLPWDSHQNMTSVLVWDTGRPNGDQHHPLVPVGPVVRSTAATCLAVAVTCPHYGPNTTMSLSMGEGYIYSACKSNQMALNGLYMYAQLFIIGVCLMCVTWLSCIYLPHVFMSMHTNNTCSCILIDTGSGMVSLVENNTMREST